MHEMYARTCGPVHTCVLVCHLHVMECQKRVVMFAINKPINRRLQWIYQCSSSEQFLLGGIYWFMNQWRWYTIVKIISYTVLICIMLGFVTVTDDAMWNHQSLVRWSCVRADTICIMQSMLHKCLLALVTPRGSEVFSHSAHSVPHEEPPPRPAVVW